MRIVAAFLTLALPGALCAQEVSDFDYTYVDASLVNTEIELGFTDVDGDGIGINGSFGLSDTLNIVYGYSDIGYDFDVDSSTMNVGLGFHTDINDDIDFVADVQYIDVSVDTPFGDADDDGLGISGGIRAHVGDSLELDAGLQYVDLEDSDTVLRVGGRYYFNDSFALSAGISDADAGMSWSVGVRAEFGGK
jgi:hypothetical protein